MDTVRKVSAMILAIAVLLPQYSCGEGDTATVLYAYDHKELWWAILSVLMYLVPLALTFVPNVRWSTSLGIVAVGTTLYFRGYQVIVVATTLLVGWWVGVIASAVYLVACLALLIHHIRQK